MLLLPVARLAPCTGKVAVPFDNCTAPSVVAPAEVPTENVTVPVGITLPARGFTNAVTCAVPDGAILALLTLAVVAVPAAGGTTVTTTELLELPKLAVAVKFAVIVSMPTARLA